LPYDEVVERPFRRDRPLLSGSILNAALRQVTLPPHSRAITGL